MHSGTSSSKMSKGASGCKPIGILNVRQTEGRKSLRNDRLIVVPVDSTSPPGASDIRKMPASLRHQAEEFFVAATAGTGKTLKFLGWGGPRAAMAAVRRACKTFETSS
jgi:inorganic pyrophosphatase